MYENTKLDIYNNNKNNNAVAELHNRKTVFLDTIIIKLYKEVIKKSTQNLKLFKFIHKNVHCRRKGSHGWNKNLQIQLRLVVNEWRQSVKVNTGTFYKSGTKNLPGFKINL